ncbi:hypothetical protein ACFQ0X_43830 [Streptomyces rectiviolaceus]|uniref:Uncharacterized protein n=1 Tax=Streptomyces rectiviolaceus TaxID=332591 RepID=A0ABP6MGK9_9ACTN
MATATEPTTTVYDIESNTVLYRIPATEARRDLDMHRDCGATVHEYGTTDRNDAPLHVVITVALPRRRCAPDQGAVYEFPGSPATDPTDPPTPQTPTADPANLPAPPAPTGTFATALALYRTKGAAHAPNHALMAGLCQDTIQTLVGAVSPQLVWEGAMKNGLTAKELLHLCNTDFMAVDDLQWI